MPVQQPVDGTGLLAGRRVLVTGGSRGIGRAIIEACVTAGARCAMLARSAESIEAAQQHFRAAGFGEVAGVRGDVGKPADVQRAVDEAAAALGGLDVLVNGAARVSGREPDGVFTTTAELMITDFTEKVVGYLRCARAAHPYLEHSAGGRIINIGGEAVRQATSNVSSGARNAAVVHLTRSLAMELGPAGITVNAVHPGLVLTDIVRDMLASRSVEAYGSPDTLAEKLAARNAIRRLVRPADVANTVLFLASDLAAGITGEAITVSGGSSPAVHY